MRIDAMSKRRAPDQRWRIGDACRVPWHDDAGQVGGWGAAEVVAVRGDRVVVRRWRWESEHPWWELRRPAKHRGLWHRWWTHDKRAGRLT